MIEINMSCPDFFQHDWANSNLTIKDNGDQTTLAHLISQSNLPPFANQSLDTLPAQVCSKWNLTQDLTQPTFQVTVMDQDNKTLWGFQPPASSKEQQGTSFHAPATVDNGPDQVPWVGVSTTQKGPMFLSFAFYAQQLVSQGTYHIQIVGKDGQQQFMNATVTVKNDSTLFNCQPQQIETYDGKCCTPTRPENLQCGQDRCARPLWRNWFQQECLSPSTCNKQTNMCQPILNGTCPDLFNNIDKSNVIATFQTTDFMAGVKNSPLNLPPIPQIPTNANYQLYPLSVCMPFFMTAPVTKGSVNMKVTLKSGKNVVTLWQKSDLPLFADGYQGMTVKEPGDVANTVQWVGFPEMQFIEQTPVQAGTQVHLMFGLYNILTNPDDILTITLDINGTLTNLQDVTLMTLTITVDNSTNTCPTNHLMTPNGQCCQPPSQWDWSTNKMWQCGDDGCNRPVFHNYFQSIQQPFVCTDHQVQCQPECDGRQCGDDRCGGSCGDCAHGPCSPYGTCCTPTCNGKKCGPDGCGGTCGTCPKDQTCS
ncbi:MAG: hypothetical protein K0U52_03245, partial [Gammaproteobacteria bacterium]|nr:hypothetical protein [Gammaproteobacteria bacterium]